MRWYYYSCYHVTRYIIHLMLTFDTDGPAIFFTSKFEIFRYIVPRYLRLWVPFGLFGAIFSLLVLEGFCISV
jgi:hypothetical protein